MTAYPMNDWIPADWPAPAHIHAGTTTRLNGVSHHPFDSFNLAAHVGDQPDAVARNRRQLRERLHLPAEPAWLQQRHGDRVVRVEHGQRPTADGAYTDASGEVCAVLTADCIPLLLCNRNGTQIAALHIGWRGLCKRIIKRGLSMFDAAPHELLAWVGPHISLENYEVGADVITACSATWPETRDAIRPSRPDHWYLDLGQLVKAELSGQGVEDVYGCTLCTFAREDLFYSYRRDGVTGRMASLIWMEPPHLDIASVRQ